tara:strand:+ start:89 stop:217 length:129 start_codon:yes stop_codon:yes gene_type:complete
MIKKICLVLFLIAVFSSCGKKGDPKYEKNKSEILNTNTRVVL